MKINSNNLYKYKEVNSRYIKNNSELKRLQKDNLKEKYNTEIPAKAISFSGFNISNSNKLTHKVIEFIYKHEVIYSSIFSLIVAGIIKPACVLNMPGSETKDKEIVATKNFLQAFIGSFLSFTVGGQIIDKIVNNIKTMVDPKKIRVITNEKGEKVIEAIDKNDEVLKRNIKILNKNPKFVEELLINGDEKYLENQAGEIVQLIKNNAPADLLNEKLNLFLKNVLENTQHGYKYIKDDKTKGIVSCKYIVNQLSDEFCNNIKTTQNPEELVKTFLKSIKNYMADETKLEVYNSIWKNSSGWLTSILKAGISSKLLPIVMPLIIPVIRNVTTLLFSKNKENTKKETKTETLTTSRTFLLEKANYKVFTNNNKKNTEINFKGNVNPIVKLATTAFETMSVSKFSEKMVNFFHTLPKPLNKTSARMSDIESYLITTYWFFSTLFNKNIAPDQKLGLNVHTVLVTAVGSISALIVDTLFDPLINLAKKNYSKNLTNIAQKSFKEVSNLNTNSLEDIIQIVDKNCPDVISRKNVVEQIANSLSKDVISQFKNGEIIKDSDISNLIINLTKNYGKMLSKFKSLTIFTLLVRFLVPVKMVPVGGKIKKGIKEFQEKKSLKKQVA